MVKGAEGGAAADDNRVDSLWCFARRCIHCEVDVNLPYDPTLGQQLRTSGGVGRLQCMQRCISSCHQGDMQPFAFCYTMTKVLVIVLALISLLTQVN